MVPINLSYSVVTVVTGLTLYLSYVTVSFNVQLRLYTLSGFTLPGLYQLNEKFLLSLYRPEWVVVLKNI